MTSEELLVAYAALSGEVQRSLTLTGACGTAEAAAGDPSQTGCPRRPACELHRPEPEASCRRNRWINKRTTTVQCDGRAWRVAFALLQHVTDITPSTVQPSTTVSTGLLPLKSFTSSFSICSCRASPPCAVPDASTAQATKG
jgi:hypothetical protein